MSSSGLEATEQELDAFAGSDNDGIPDGDDDGGDSADE